MYMRYAGGGVGHYHLEFSDTRNNVDHAPMQEEDEFSGDTDPPASTIPRVPITTTLQERREAAEAAGAEEVEETGDGQAIEDDLEDDKTDSESEDANPNGEGENLGAEDGEGGFVDAEDDEGYAPL